MLLIRAVSLELYKLLKKKTTYLLFITLSIPLVFGIGMYGGISFIYEANENSFDVLTDSTMTAMEFTANMYGSSLYVTILIVIIIASLSFAREIEGQQISLIVNRICVRPVIVVSKYIALTIISVIYLMIFYLFSTSTYYFLVCNSSYGNGIFILAEEIPKYSGYLILSLLSILVITAIAFAFGAKLKTFLCFGSTFVVWIVIKYLDYFDTVRLFVPELCMDALMEASITFNSALKWGSVFVIYIIMLVSIAAFQFSRNDIK